MRRCRPVSLSRTQVALRSFQLVPSTVDFGPLAEGSSASVTVRMKNVGVDLCRYEQQTQVTCGSGSDRRPSVFRKVPSEAASGEDGPASGVQPRPGRPRPGPPRPTPARRCSLEAPWSSRVNVCPCRCLQGCTWTCSCSCWRRPQEPQGRHRPASTTTSSSRRSWRSSTCPSLLISFRVLVFREGPRTGPDVWG